MQHLINIHFTSPSLGARMLGRGPGSAKPAGRGDAAAMLYFVFNRQVVGVVVAHDLEQGEFVAQVRLWLCIASMPIHHACTRHVPSCPGSMCLPVPHKYTIDMHVHVGTILSTAPVAHRLLRVSLQGPGGWCCRPEY